MYTFVITHQIGYCVYKIDLNKVDILECKREWTRKGLKEWIWTDWEMSRWSGHGDKQSDSCTKSGYEREQKMW